MTPAGFAVHAVPAYERLSNKLRKAHPEFEDAEKSAVSVLAADPYNRTRRHHIKKLEGVPAGDGQFRLALGRWRFRYDIIQRVVLLTYCGLRREDTY
jgi:hypothetical protein